MISKFLPRFLLLSLTLFTGICMVKAQNSLRLKYKNSAIYAGIEVGAKGIKMSLLEVGKNAKKNGSFNKGHGC